MDETRIAFCQPQSRIRELSDSEFLQSLGWESTARKSLVVAAENGDAETFYRKLQKHGFGKRPARRGGTAEECAFEPRSFWSRAAFAETPRTAALIEIAQKLSAAKRGKPAKMQARRPKRQTANRKHAAALSPRRVKQLAQWLARTASDVSLSPLELQILLELMLQFGNKLPDDLFGRLWRSSLTAAVELSVELDERLGSQASDDQRLMIQGELPWAAGLLFPDIAGAELMREFGRQHLAEQLEDKTDTDGIPQAELLENLSLWLAPMVRASEWANLFGVDLWEEQEADRFRRLVKVIVSLCCADGRLAFGNGQIPKPITMLVSAMRLAGWKQKSVPLSYLLTVADNRDTGRPGRGRIGKARLRQKLPTVQSDWARVACLRSDWALDADTLVVTHHRDKPRIELSPAGNRLLSGTWDIDLMIDGQPQEFVNQWTCTCWFSDEDADYFEIQLTLEGIGRVERQLLLSRTDQFAVLADSISVADGVRIDYTSRLPVVEGVSIEPDVRTRECRLRRQGLHARIFALALPADRVLSTAGAFGPVGEGLELKQIAIGGLYAPLVIDWHPDRRRLEADWRTLTVSEEGRIQKSESASGHRLRIGDHQLLLYRSLREPDVPRAVLGQHTSNETIIGRFDADGELTPIVIVE
jgi:hypothetical protein